MKQSVTLVLLLCLKCMVSRRSLQENEALSEIVFSVTYRNFLPATCASTDAAIQKRVDAWNSATSLDDPFTCDRYIDSFARNQIEANFDAGIISPHPDFNALPLFSDLGNFTCDVVEFPVGSCSFEEVDGDFVKISNASIIKDDLFVGSNGLGKPVYCDDSQGKDSRCGFNPFAIQDPDGTAQQQSTKEFFDVWYNDDLVYNKRIGGRLVLTPKDGSNETFNFDSRVDVEDPSLGDDISEDHFGPLDKFQIGPTRIFQGNFKDAEFFSATIVDFVDLPVWPYTINSAGDPEGVNKTLNKAYYVTTELHTTFEYRSDREMIFTFRGDDDFWAFINNKLVIDLGGMHSVLSATIDLNSDLNVPNTDLTLQEYLGLENGVVATLDVFHAERQASFSNFQVTTSLFAACNVVQSGSKATDITRADDPESFIFTAGASFDDTETEITLQSKDSAFSAGSFFTAKQENVGRGFQLDLEVSVAEGITEGFAIVVQAQGAEDFPVSGGSSFGIQGLTQSFAILFDFCNNRGEITNTSDCAGQQVSVHYPDSSEGLNSASVETRHTFDSIARNVMRSEFFPVQIIHYGGAPNFLEVYVNKSLYLRENDFDILSILNSTGAHVGMTASASEESTDIKVRNFELRTVEVVPNTTEFAPIENISVIVADGVDKTEGVLAVTNDFCQNQIEAGTLDDLFTVVYILVPETDETEGRRLQDEDENDNNLTFTFGVVQDNGDGSYNLQLQTEVPGSYRAVFTFGEDCDLVQDGDDFVLSPTSNVGDCPYVTNDNAIIAVATPEPEPEKEDVEDVLADSGLPLIAIFTTGAICFFCVFFVLAFYIKKRKKWLTEKKYVMEGEIYKTEMQTKFDHQTEYNTTAIEVLNTQREILELKTHAKLNSRNEEIVGLESENEVLKDALRKTKAEFSEQENAELIRLEGEYENEEIPSAPRVKKTEF